jgi:hypothetical protein
MKNIDIKPEYAEMIQVCITEEEFKEQNLRHRPAVLKKQKFGNGSIRGIVNEYAVKKMKNTIPPYKTTFIGERVLNPESGSIPIPKRTYKIKTVLDGVITEWKSITDFAKNNTEYKPSVLSKLMKCQKEIPITGGTMYKIPGNVYGLEKTEIVWKIIMAEIITLGSWKKEI